MCKAFRTRRVDLARLVEWRAMRLFLVRHGQTKLNQENVAMGQMDVPLNAKGLEQLAALRERFDGVHVDHIYSSDLLRCRQTSAALEEATGAPVSFHPELRERSFGEWEGQDYRDVTARLQALALENHYPLYDARPPGGESHSDMWKRIEPMVARICSDCNQAIIVSHGGSCRVLLSILLRATLESTFSFRFDNTSVTQLDRRAEGAMVLSLYNDTSHLSEGSPEAIPVVQ
jgi:broad specificity phosphatase PhoE